VNLKIEPASSCLHFPCQQHESASSVQHTAARQPSQITRVSVSDSLLGSQHLLRKRMSSTQSADEDWGFWAEFIAPEEASDGAFALPLIRSSTLPVETPAYMLEEKLPDQALWHITAGLRPTQPATERERFEELWKSNFSHSQVDYNKPLPPSKSTSKPTVIFKGRSPYLARVTKSFSCAGCGSGAQFKLSVSSFRVVRSSSSGSDMHAEYLIVLEVGELTFGAWKRHTDFEKLARTISTGGALTAPFRNSRTAWAAVLRQKRFSRCLDRYLPILRFMYI
jgi:hypothetical protein